MRKEEIGNELTTISPLVEESLLNLKRETAPQGYFDELEASVLEHIALEKFRDELSASETVPDTYFDNLTDKIMSKLASERSISLRIIKLVSSHSAVKFAAAVLFFISIGMIVQLYKQPEKNQMDAITEQAYIDYLKKNIDDVDISMLIQARMIDEGVLNDIPSYTNMRDLKSSDNDE
jgi:hypothetical protein